MYFSRVTWQAHATPLRWDQQGRVMRPKSCPPESAGPALGLMDEFEFVTTEETITAGDRMVLFTDGLFEAAAPDGEEFGAARLAAALTGQAGQPLDATLTALLGQVTEFCGGAAFADDVCIGAVELDRT